MLHDPLIQHQATDIAVGVQELVTTQWKLPESLKI